MLLTILAYASPLKAQKKDSENKKTEKAKPPRKEVRFAPEWGLNLSNYTFSYNNASVNTTARLSVKLGLTMDAQISGGLYFEPGLFYVGNGFSYTDNSIGGQGETISMKLSAIDVPLMFQYNFGTINKGMFFIGLGMYMAFHVGGTIKDNQTFSGINGERMQFGNDASDNMKGNDIGLASEVGYRFANNFIIKLYRQTGLLNLVPDARSSTYSMKSDALTFTIAVMMKSGKKKEIQKLH